MKREEEEATNQRAFPWFTLFDPQRTFSSLVVRERDGIRNQTKSSIIVEMGERGIFIPGPIIRLTALLDQASNVILGHQIDSEILLCIIFLPQSN